jgi:hypothetical protein
MGRIRLIDPAIDTAAQMLGKTAKNIAINRAKPAVKINFDGIQLRLRYQIYG